MNTTLAKVISGIMALFILSYVGYQVYQYFYSPYKTETVFETVIADSEDVQGVMMRDEQVLSEKKTGVVSCYYANGSKVAKNSEIAKIYQKEQDVISQYQIKQIDKELQMLKSCQEQVSAGSTQTDALDKQVNEKHLQLLAAVDTNSLEGLEDIKYSLMTSLNKRQIVIGKEKDFSARINTLNQEKNSLQKGISSNPKAVTTPVSGYFVDEVDGFESTVVLKDGETLSVKKVQDLISQPVQRDDQVIGKILLTHEWTFAAVIDSDDALKYRKGAVVSLDFSTLPEADVEATVQNVITEKGNDKSVVLFAGSMMNEGLSTLRVDKAKVSFKNNRGLKVTKDALHIVNGEKGVYRVLGGEMRFKKVDVIYETEDYILSAQHADDSDYLQLYDDVVVKGKDLYDKKPVK